MRESEGGSECDGVRVSESDGVKKVGSEGGSERE